MHKIKIIVFLVLIAILAVSAIQYRYSFVRESLLKGYYSQPAPPDLKYFTWKRWFSKNFQNDFMTRMNDNTGFRNTLIRIKNQYDYSFFKVVHAKGFLTGRNRFLFEEDYIHEYTGKYFIGTKVIDEKLSRLKNVMDSLSFYHIPLILVFEPGKASFYPEYIPERFHPEKRTLTNYEYFLRRSEDLGLSYLDLNRYFLQMRDTAHFPLFPRYGMHWSLYGVHLAANELSRYIGKVSGKSMPEFKTAYLQHTHDSPGTDYDIGELCNLIFPMKPSPGVYPVVAFDSMPAGTMPALIVADSYYVNMVESYGQKMFGRQDYWYYNGSLYPHQNETPQVRVDKSGLREKLKQYDVILLMVSEINLHCCFWDFADEAYRAFHPGMNDSKLDSIENKIRIDREWFRFMVKKSKEENRPLDQVIRSNAEYAFIASFNDLQGKNYRDSIQYFILNIRNNEEWLELITKNAREQNMPLDSAIMLNAVYSYSQSKKNQ
ncbi:MAG: hypothetical protein Q8M08_01875 [Bacteroidales bacterium]|nr:hypothetical protein [Bacteroidales bacterium]